MSRQQSRPGEFTEAASRAFGGADDPSVTNGPGAITSAMRTIPAHEGSAWLVAAAQRRVQLLADGRTESRAWITNDGRMIFVVPIGGRFTASDSTEDYTCDRCLTWCADGLWPFSTTPWRGTASPWAGVVLTGGLCDDCARLEGFTA